MIGSGLDNSDALHEFPQHPVETMIETRHDDRIAVILLGGRVKVEYAFQAKQIFARSAHGHKLLKS